MCGIAGFIAPVASDEAARILRAMTDTIAHRGPDAEGFFQQAAAGQRRVALGHRRLSIIDLAGGVQPMRDEAAGLTLSYNGEVYNFRELRASLAQNGLRFSTDSDTEVVLRAYQRWGDACVEHLRGMFAFALWDEPKQRLFLARDRFGKKPLFLWEGAGRFLFASEIKALLATPWPGREVDTESVWHYLAYRYVPGPATLLRNVRKLPPGSALAWENGRTREWRYWRTPDCEPRVAAPLEDPVGAFLAALDEAVRIRMVADVPYGAFLSGGLDSSTIVGLMSRHTSQPVRTFSIGFREARYSELDHARTVAERFGADHTERVVTERDMMDLLPALVRFRDAPVSEPADIPIYLLSVEARRSVKMVLTGEGSDELLAGYPKHAFERYAEPYHRLPPPLRRRLVEPLVHALPYRFRRAKTAIESLTLGDPRDRYPRWFGALSPDERARLCALPAARAHEDGLPFDAAPGTTALRRLLAFDQMSWLPDNLLERGDRMTMAASLEARMPFMDHELGAFISRLPDRARLRGHKSKWVLRRAAERLLPAEILARPKVGFRVPVNEWLRGPMADYLRDHLLGTDSRTRQYYRRAELERIVGEHIEGRQNHEKTLWMLLGLEIWHRETLPEASEAIQDAASL